MTKSYFKTTTESEVAYILLERLKKAVKAGRAADRFRCLWCGDIHEIVFGTHESQWSFSNEWGKHINGFTGEHDEYSRGTYTLKQIFEMHDKYEQRKAL